MKIIPRPGKIHVLLDSVDERKVGLIHIPGLHSEKTRVGTVVSVGKDITDVSPGDRIAVSFYAGVNLLLFELGETGLTDRNRMIIPGEILGNVAEE